MPPIPILAMKTTDVKKVIFAFGLLSKNNDQKPWTIAHQFVVFLFVLLNSIRLVILLIWVKGGSIWGVYLGDLVYYMAPEERDLLLFALVLVSSFWLHSAFYIFQEWINRGKKMSWLELLKTCALESFDFSRIGLCRKDSIRFRKRVWLTTRLCLAYVVSFDFICGVCGVYIVAANFPFGYRIFPGILHALNLSISCHFLICFAYGMMFFFHQISYFFQLRFNDIHSKLRFLKSQNAVQIHLLPLLKEFDSLYKQVFKFNQFWKYPLAIDYSFILMIVLLMTYLGFFSEMSWIYRAVCAVGAVLVFVMLCALSLSAASVIKSARKSYVLLNSIAVKHLPTRLRLQLLFTIQRMAGPDRFIGFTCLDVFAITYSKYFHIMMHLFTHFLLLLDTLVVQKGVNRAQEAINNALQ